jgi:hypothetical protein
MISKNIRERILKVEKDKKIKDEKIIKEYKKFIGDDLSKKTLQEIIKAMETIIQDTKNANNLSEAIALQVIAIEKIREK